MKISMKKLIALWNVSAIVGVASFVPPLQQQLVAKSLLAAKSQVDREWVEEDLKKASKAENESRDWVAEDMNKMGEAGSPLREDWVYRDMKKAGEGGSHEPVLRKEQRKTSKKYDAIAKDMATTGASDTADWVARDMSKAGNPDEDSKFTTTSWLRDLNRKFDDERDRDYKDIRDDMEKTGKAQGEVSLRTELDMQKTGHAESPLDHLAAFFQDVTYKLDDWWLKAFQQDEIKKDMESGGRTTDQSWVGHDMEMTGKKSDSVSSYRAPDQKKELREELSKSEHNKWISEDMQESGDAVNKQWQARKDIMATHKTSNLVAADLKIMGTAETNELIRHDMEDSGHPDSHPLSSSMGSQEMGQYKREMSEFNELEHHKTDMPKAQHKRTSWEPAEEEDQTQHKHKYLHFVVRLLKKAVMPWKDWKKL